MTWHQAESPALVLSLQEELPDWLVGVPKNCVSVKETVQLTSRPLFSCGVRSLKRQLEPRSLLPLRHNKNEASGVVP